MAKSLRSKWRRKMRNIKRERYGKKELIRLKKMLGLPTDDDTSPVGDVDVKTEPEISEIANVITTKDERRISAMVRSECDIDDSEADDEIMEITRLAKAKKFRKSYIPRLQRMGKLKPASLKKPATDKGPNTITGEEQMLNTTTGEEQMEHSQVRVYDERTFMDQYGSFPVWMNKKSVRQLSKKNRRMKKHLIKKESRRRKRGTYSKASMEKETVGLEEAISGLENVAVEGTTSTD